jgi:hypothetical protein
MEKTENGKVRITLDEATKIKGRSNPAQIIAEQRKEQVKEKKK